MADIDYTHGIILISDNGYYTLYDFDGNRLTNERYTQYEKLYDTYCLYGDDGGAIYYKESRKEKRFADNYFVSLQGGYYLHREGASYRINLYDRDDRLIRTIYDADTQYEAYVCDKYILYNNRKLNVWEIYDVTDRSYYRDFDNTGYTQMAYTGMGKFIIIEEYDSGYRNYIFDAVNDVKTSVNMGLIAIFNSYNTTDWALNEGYSLCLTADSTYITDYDQTKVYVLDGTSLNFIDGFAINNLYTTQNKVTVTRLYSDGTPQKSYLVFDNCSSVIYNQNIFTYNVIEANEVKYGAKDANGRVLFNASFDGMTAFVNGYALSWVNENDEKEYYRLSTDGTSQKVDITTDGIENIFYYVSDGQQITIFSFDGNVKKSIEKTKSDTEVSDIVITYQGGYFKVDGVLYLIKMN